MEYPTAGLAVWLPCFLFGNLFSLVFFLRAITQLFPAQWARLTAVLMPWRGEGRRELLVLGNPCAGVGADDSGGAEEKGRRRAQRVQMAHAPSARCAARLAQPPPCAHHAATPLNPNPLNKQPATAGRAARRCRARRVPRS